MGKTFGRGRPRSPAAAHAAAASGAAEPGCCAMLSRRRTPSPRHRTKPRKPTPCRSTRCRYSPRPEAPPQAPSNRHRRPERHLPAGPSCLDPCRRTSAPGDVPIAQARKVAAGLHQVSPGRLAAARRQTTPARFPAALASLAKTGHPGQPPPDPAALDPQAAPGQPTGSGADSQRGSAIMGYGASEN